MKGEYLVVEQKPSTHVYNQLYYVVRSITHTIHTFNINHTVNLCGTFLKHPKTSKPKS